VQAPGMPKKQKDNLGQIDKFLETVNLPRPNCEEVGT
jgi:hypothetical protein